MNIIDEKIIKFISKHHIFSLATSINNLPYCCTCYYIFDKVKQEFYFTSENISKHYNDITKNSYVAVNIALETKIIGKIQGLQITGTSKILKEDELFHARNKYLKKYPYALPFITKSDFFSLSPDFMKFTDNNLGFGKKLIWNKTTDFQ